MLFILIICLVLADKPAIKEFFDTALTHAVSTHCPFADMKGLHKMCGLEAINQASSLPVTLGTGWDPIKAEIKIPLFNFTNYKNNIYRPHDNQSKWRVPDQIKIIPRKSNRIMTNLYSNIDKYLDQMNPTRSNVSAGNLALPIDMIPDFFHWFQSGAANIVSVSQIVNLFDMELETEPVLSPYFNHMIAALPTEFDMEIYAMFIDYVGTEVVVAAKVGGSAHQTVMTKNCFGSVDLTNQAALYMEKTFEPEKYSNTKFSAGFEQYSRASIIDVYGGDPKIVNQAKWVDRVATMSDYPVLTDVVVKPITSFIRDQTIRSNVQKVIDQYYSKGNANIQAYRQAYADSMKRPKTVTFVSLHKPPSQVRGTQSMILNSGQRQMIDKGIIKDELFNGFVCERISDMKIRASVDSAQLARAQAILKGPGPPVTIIASVPGAEVSFGCSAVSYHFSSAFVPESLSDVVGRCCMDCIPSVTEYELLGCVCPPF